MAFRLQGIPCTTARRSQNNSPPATSAGFPSAERQQRHAQTRYRGFRGFFAPFIRCSARNMMRHTSVDDNLRVCPDEVQKPRLGSTPPTTGVNAVAEVDEAGTRQASHVGLVDGSRGSVRPGKRRAQSCVSVMVGCEVKWGETSHPLKYIPSNVLGGSMNCRGGS